MPRQPSTKCRFKEVDSTNFPGLYEMQLADARFAVSSAKTLRINISGATNLLDKEILIQLTAHDLVDSAQVQADIAKVLTVAPTLDSNNALNVSTKYTAGILASAGPQTLWVATTGNDSNSGLTRSAPFLTVAAAITAANPGDTIRVLAGTYATAVTNSKNGITIIGDSRSTTILSTTTGAAFTNTGSHLTLRNLKLLTTGTTTSTPAFTDANTFGTWLDQCDLRGGDDAYNGTNCYGARITGCRLFSHWDCIVGTGEVYVEGCYITSDGAYSDPSVVLLVVSANNAFVRNCFIDVNRTVDATGDTYAVASILGVFEACTISCQVTGGSATGRAVAVSTQNAGSNIFLRGCKLTSVHSADSAKAYDFFSGDSTSVISLQATQINTAKVNDTSRIRWLDGGPDLANVHNPTATNALTNTTISTSQQVVATASSPTTLQATTIATLTSQTVFTLTAGSADNDAYNGDFVVFQDQSTSTQKSVCIISDYVGSTKTVTLLNAPVFTVATGDTVSIIANPNSAIVSPFNVDSDHTWAFHTPSQTTAPNILSESIGFIGLLAMDFSEPMPAKDSIASISAASFANIAGTEPTVLSSAVSPDAKQAHIRIDATSATAGTYTLSVTIVTTDSQTFTRSGRLTVA
jgi:hypothetical protein